MKKYINDEGKVAILYAPNYGSGWYSWNKDKPEMVFCPEIVEAIINSDKNNFCEELRINYINEIAERLFPDACLSAIPDLTIYWLPKNTLFKIDEYDGAESIKIYSTNDYLSTGY